MKRVKKQEEGKHDETCCEREMNINDGSCGGSEGGEEEGRYQR